ncbi:MAG: ABC transporter ATP-binding protein [Chloroflexi bacterium HGW-Chloroflexi-3]|nr:MAG: ABC transporter ATP-binding protein [Chloroflexi bacterium HGW-Chloroflexi-3]
MLEIQNIEVKYGKATVLHDVSISIQQGEIVTILGSNGSGKTTIMRSILGLAPIVTGQITFLGEKINHLKPHQIVTKGIVVVPEGRGIFPKLSVEENLRTGYVFFENDKEKMNQNIQDAYSRFPILGQRHNQLAGTLSGGEQTMLAVSRAMMRKPKLLLMDEPSLGLSPKLVQQTFSIIKELHETGTSILLIEQNAVKALAICNRGYILQKGKVVLSGDKQELISDEGVRKAYFAM